MKTNKVLKVKLSKEWSDHTHEYPNGPGTFIRHASKEPGVIQVSFTLYEKGEIPNPSCEDLIELAKKIGDNLPAGDLVETSSGRCTFGIFGTAIFKSKEFPRTQVWYLSDGYNFILATHICTALPEPEEVAEAQEIISSIFITKRPFWKYP